MRRVPLPIVILLSFAVIGGAWWLGTRNYDFLTPPSATQIEIARSRAARHFAQPSALFAVDQGPDLPLEVIESPRPAPTPQAAIPTIDPGDLSKKLTLDSWSRESSKPAASFINLASTLETDSQLAAALLAWERVLDHSSPTPDERNAALNGIRRLRATLSPWNDDSTNSSTILLKLETPADRLQLTRRAAKSAATILDTASSGLIHVEYAIRKSKIDGETPILRVILQHPETATNESSSPSVQIPAPESSEGLETAILDAAFKLIASRLALDESLSPVSSPSPGESPADSLQLRITRLAWLHFADSLKPSQNP